MNGEISASITWVNALWPISNVICQQKKRPNCKCTTAHRCVLINFSYASKLVIQMAHIINLETVYQNLRLKINGHFPNISSHFFVKNSFFFTKLQGHFETVNSWLVGYKVMIQKTKIPFPFLFALFLFLTEEA